MGRDRPRDASRDRQIDRLLTEALERPASERRAFIEHATAGDGDLRRQVLQMLQQAELEDGELATGALLRDGLGEDLLETEFGDDASGRQIGPYRLLHPLGRGGSATVYLGERTDGAFEHRVAIKVLHAAEGAVAGVAQRFEQERQILAGLTHAARRQVDEVPPVAQGLAVPAPWWSTWTASPSTGSAAPATCRYTSGCVSSWTSPPRLNLRTDI